MTDTLREILADWIETAKDDTSRAVREAKVKEYWPDFTY